MGHKYINGIRVELTPQEDAIEAAKLAAHLAGALDRAKNSKEQEIRTEANTRISSIFGETDPAKLMAIQLRSIANAVRLVRGETRGGPNNAELDALSQRLTLVEDIRSAEESQIVQMRALLTENEVRNFQITWPS